MELLRGVGAECVDSEDKEQNATSDLQPKDVFGLLDEVHDK